MRISGVVVAVDEFEGRRVYTVDDSSGATIECVANIPLPPKPTTKSTSKSTTKLKDEIDHHPLPVTDGEVDVGHVIDVKGSIKPFRDSKQVRADKISHLRSTDQEVQFWEKLVQLRREVLSRPWVLTGRELRRCRKESEGDRDVRRRTGLTKKEKRHDSVQSAGTSTTAAPIPARADAARFRHREREREGRHARVESVMVEKPAPAPGLLPPQPPKIKETGLERRKKSFGRIFPVSGKYDALGL